MVIKSNTEEISFFHYPRFVHDQIKDLDMDQDPLIENDDILFIVLLYDLHVIC